MIGAAQVVETALAEAARLGRADETIVLVTDRSTASLRWAGNSMTTNGESWTRSTTVISIVSDAYVWTPGDALWDVGVPQVSDRPVVQEQQKYQADVRSKQRVGV